MVVVAGVVAASAVVVADAGVVAVSAYIHSECFYTYVYIFLQIPKGPRNALILVET